mmetsp:Transcript_53716/g.154939  ORF Transcript_53716/g.154939 Transcript_53716/m.154939 type:complete len:350 (-) Transcript_53716:358-1407(-)
MLCRSASLLVYFSTVAAGSGLRGQGAVGDCVRQTDCAVSEWCNAVVYGRWCAENAASCPEPICIRSTAATTPALTPSTSSPGSTTPPPAGSGIGSWFTEADFERFFPNIDAAACTGKHFFTREALMSAAAAFPSFANSGDVTQDKLELAAFLGQTSHETTGGWATAPGGPQAWGYCFKEEVGCGTGTCTGYCAAGNPCAQFGFDCACVAGQTYHGRGPMQLSWNYNYGLFSRDVFGNPAVLLEKPSEVASNATMAFMTGIWFWMTPQSPKPSCHDVMVGAWAPTDADSRAGRVPGYGMVTNIINGGLECNMPTGSKVEDRVAFYQKFADILGVQVDRDTLYCDGMVSYR